MQPGDTITPGQTPAPNQAGSQGFEYRQEAPVQDTPPPQSEQPRQADEPVGQSEYSPIAENALVEWSASEYIDHHKTTQWYLALILVSILLGVILYFITQDVISVVAVLLAAGLFGVSGAKKPRTLSYQITNLGVRIAERLYPYEDIKHFSVQREGGISSIQLFPLRRFMPALTIYYPPDSEEAVVNALASYLPHEEQKNDPVDRLMKRLRF